MEGTTTAMSTLLSGVSDAMTSVSSVFTDIAATIAETPLLLLFAVALPVISFGVGLLIRVLHRA